MDYVNLLSKSIWKMKDMEAYLEYKQLPMSKSRLYRAVHQAKERYNGDCGLGNQYFKRDSVLALFGTNLEEELRNLERINNGRSV